jgi:uncharacterized protein (TIRG00374 family)
MKKVLAGLFVSLVCLGLVLWNVDWLEVWRHLGQVDLPLMGLAMLGMLAAYFLMSWRWQQLLAPLVPRAHLPVPGLFGAMMTGYLFNTFFPARAGDLMRAHLLSRRTGLSKTTILATVVIEKLFDGLALLVLLVLGLLGLPLSGASEQIGGAAVVVLVGALGGLILFKWQADRAVALTEWVTGYLPIPARLKQVGVRLVRRFAEGLQVFEQPGPLIRAAAISLAVWLVVAGMFWAALASFHMPPSTMTLSAVLFLTALVNLGLLVPAMPGNVGTYEGLIIWSLLLLMPTLDKDLRVAFALLFHVGQLVTTLIVGTAAFWTQHISLREVQEEEREAITVAPEPAARAADTELGIERL